MPHHSATATSCEPLALQRVVCGWTKEITLLTPALRVCTTYDTLKSVLARLFLCVFLNKDFLIKCFLHVIWAHFRVPTVIVLCIQ